MGSSIIESLVRLDVDELQQFTDSQADGQPVIDLVFLGMGEDYHPLPWDQLTYDTDKGGYVVNLTKEQLEGAPRYSAGNEPTFDRAYGQQVYGYYGSSYNY